VLVRGGSNRPGVSGKGKKEKNAAKEYDHQPIQGRHLVLVRATKMGREMDTYRS